MRERWSLAGLRTMCRLANMDPWKLANIISPPSLPRHCSRGYFGLRRHKIVSDPAITGSRCRAVMKCDEARESFFFFFPLLYGRSSGVCWANPRGRPSPLGRANESTSPAAWRQNNESTYGRKWRAGGAPRLWTQVHALAQRNLGRVKSVRAGFRGFPPLPRDEPKAARARTMTWPASPLSRVKLKFDTELLAPLRRFANYLPTVMTIGHRVSQCARQTKSYLHMPNVHTGSEWVEARPRSRCEGAIRATLTRTPSASSLLRARRAIGVNTDFAPNIVLGSRRNCDKAKATGLTAPYLDKMLGMKKGGGGVFLSDGASPLPANIAARPDVTRYVTTAGKRTEAQSTRCYRSETSGLHCELQQDGVADQHVRQLAPGSALVRRQLSQQTISRSRHAVTNQMQGSAATDGVPPPPDPAEMKGRGKQEIPDKTRRPATSSGTIPTCKNQIEPGSPWWEANRLTAHPPWFLFTGFTALKISLFQGQDAGNGVQCGIVGNATLTIAFLERPQIAGKDLPRAGGSTALVTCCHASQHRVQRLAPRTTIATSCHIISEAPTASSSLPRTPIALRGPRDTFPPTWPVSVLSTLQTHGFNKDIASWRPSGGKYFTRVSEENWAALNIEVLRAEVGEVRWGWSSAGMQGRGGGREIHKKTRRLAASFGTISTCENPGVNQVRLGGRRAV
ncbi:hypothetical protein PR048_013778 [Dryococelus australis]|uniref:Uncharacterized protein n=1 Tax=Dryococelus australis TaxID=614101 RepID=A0ABQ9HT59_9NEOP|nr:hypothetical protein PR048_013778 [Dryococelus australis]